MKTPSPELKVLPPSSGYFLIGSLALLMWIEMWLKTLNSLCHLGIPMGMPSLGVTCWRTANWRGSIVTSRSAVRTSPWPSPLPRLLPCSSWPCSLPPPVPSQLPSLAPPVPSQLPSSGYRVARFSARSGLGAGAFHDWSSGGVAILLGRYLLPTHGELSKNRLLLLSSYEHADHSECSWTHSLTKQVRHKLPVNSQPRSCVSSRWAVSVSSLRTKWADSVKKALWGGRILPGP